MPPVRSGLLALVATVLAAQGCAPGEGTSCPGTAVANFQFTGSLAHQDDPAFAALVPDTLPDCTPDPKDTTTPILYPEDLPPFDATLAATPPTSAALCRSNGVVYSGEQTGSSYAFSAQADPAVLCNAACAASFRILIAGVVTTGAGGEPTGFEGLLVEVLAAARGACDGCLPPVPASDPPELSCAARYTLAGSPR